MSGYQRVDNAPCRRPNSRLEGLPLRFRQPSAGYCVQYDWLFSRLYGLPCFRAIRSFLTRLTAKLYTSRSFSRDREQNRNADREQGPNPSKEENATARVTAAAVIIQARHKGGAAREARQLSQLRELAGIVAELNRLKEQAADPAFVVELQKERSTSKMGFEEATLALLMRVDKMEGVCHPFFRQIRTAVANDIVALQEIVDNPLLQLRAIAGIEAELQNLKEQVAEAEFLDSLRKDDWLAAQIGFEEAALALRRQLGNVQGSHPVVRMVRKSLARQIVALQENVAALLPQRISPTSRVSS